MTDVAYEYTPEDLAWYAANYADTEWMVHVTGMDDCHLHQNPDLDDDDPANPVLTQESAVKLAADFNGFNAAYTARFPDDDLAPRISATVFRFGVPYEAERQVPGQREIPAVAR